MSLNSSAYTVEFVGFDGRDYSNDFDDLETAQHEAQKYSELGCHCISVLDADCNDYPW